jgi:hypothetical protein
MSSNFEIIGDIANIEVIAVETSIRELERLRKVYGPGRWRKLKGISTVRFSDRKIAKAEIHWYETHGVGKKEIKIKRII